MTEPPSSLDDWAERLGTAGLPIFSATVGAVSGVTASRQASAQDLAVAIGRDASLSARLLKIANSPYFNLQNRDIDTISEAVVLLGFDGVRELAISVSLIDEVLKGRTHELVTRHMARAFHAAAQARSFAVCRQDEASEEVFVAALLKEIGLMAFWATAVEEAADIERLREEGVADEEAESRVLGFTLRDLTLRLIDDWRLGKLLAAAAGSDDGEERVLNVQLAHDVAVAVERWGWDSEDTRLVIERVAEHLGRSQLDAERLVKTNVDAATQMATRYGVPQLQQGMAALRARASADSPPPRSGSEPEAAAHGDPLAQLNTLQSIAAHLEGEVDLHTLVTLVLEGLRDGLGFDRCYFALLSRDRGELLMKQALGCRVDTPLTLRDEPGEKNLFTVVLASRKAVHVSPGNRQSLAAVLPERLAGWISASPFVVMPVVVHERALGVLYADNEPSGRAIEEEAFAGFRHFGQQIALGLQSRAG